MPLESSGQISIGGSTLGRSINLELNRSATATSSLNEVDLRTLAGVPSGAISLANFYGKSSGSAWIFYTGSQNQDEGYKDVAVNNSAVWATGFSTSGSGYKIITTKLNPDGSVVWNKFLNYISYGYDTADQSYGIAVDSSGNSYITGLTCPGINGALDQDVFILKYDTNGTVQWEKAVINISTSGYSLETGYSIAIDPNNSDAIYIVGTVALDSGNTSGFYITKYNSSGVLQWQKTSSVANNESYATSVSIDNSGNIYVSGIHKSNGNAEEYYSIAKYNSSGTRQWLRTLLNQSTVSVDTYYGGLPAKSAVSPSGNIYIQTQRTPGGSYSTEAILTKLDTNGNTVWQRGLAGQSNFFFGATGLALDSSENVYICGYDYRSDPTLNDVITYIAKYDSSGVLQWQRRLSGSPGVSMNSSNITVLGDFLYISGMTDIFNPGTGTLNCVLTKLKTDGSKTGTYYWGGRPFVYDINSYTAFTPSYTFNTATYNETSNTFTHTSTNVPNLNAYLDYSFAVQIT